MKNRFGWIGLVSVAAVVAACGGEGDDSSAAFTPSEGAVQIGTTGIYLKDGKLIDKAPDPTTTPATPVIKYVGATQTSATTFTLTLEVDSDPFKRPAYAYLDFGSEGVYRTHLGIPSTIGPSGVGDYAQACRDALAKQNITCTDACIAACNCVSCSDDAVANNLKLGCATTCSANVSSGSIKDAPYNGSEVALAYYVYNGSPADGLQGSATQAGCDASACPSGSTSTTDSRAALKYTIDFEAPTVPELTPLVAPQVQTYDPNLTPNSLTSQPAAAGQVSMCHQGEAIPCR